MVILTKFFLLQMEPLKISILFLLFFVSSHQSPQYRSSDPISIGSKFGVKYDEALDAIFSIAIRLEALLSETNLKSSKNFLVSPLSMAVAVGELMLGARGPFIEQLHDLLVVNEATHENDSSVRHLDDHNINHYSLHQQLGDLMQNLQYQGDRDEAYTLKTASILFIQRGISINPNFRQNIHRFYGTLVKELEFYSEPQTSLAIVNTWCRNNTNNLIKELSPVPFPRYTSAILANAVYFKADWEVPFASEVNKRGIFKVSPYQTVNVTYMIGEFENYKYVENKDLGCRMVIIPYIKNEVSMYILMPTTNGDQEYDINKFAQTLRSRDIQNMILQARERKVTMVLPKMSLSNSISMLEPLKKYYMYKNAPKRYRNSIHGNVENLEDKVHDFSRNMNSTRNDNRNVNFDLGNISEDKRFRINNIYQQMTLSVNEKGTEAAAISAGIVDYIMDSVVFRVDRPFLFFIQHENTKATLFWGTIVDPTEEN